MAMSLPATPAAAQLADAALASTVASAGAAAPVDVPPEMLTRDAEGRATVRAIRLTAPLQADGRLDEAVYREVPAVTGFIQSEPAPGAPATEKTEVWVFFDDDNVYLVARCWESRPDRMVIDEMRRDHSGIAQNEQVASPSTPSTTGGTGSCSR